MNEIRKNYDAVFKEAMALFKGKVLDFLGLGSLGKILEPLPTENVEVNVRSEFADMVFTLENGDGLHLEEEVNLSEDDLLRMCGYHIWLKRIYKRDFVTVIFTKERASRTGIRSRQLSFEPIVVDCSKIDADKKLFNLKRYVRDGEEINELELLYLPLFHSTQFTPTDLFKESFNMILGLKVNEETKSKLLGLLITLTGKVVEPGALVEVYERMRKMGNRIFEYWDSNARKEEKEEIAKKLLSMGSSPDFIKEATGVSDDFLWTSDRSGSNCFTDK
jgi:hypothetical protein